MSLSSFAIKRPVTTLMIFTGFCLFGLIALTRLPVELYPDISFGQISIIVYIRGGIPPTEVESMVTLPVEEAVSTVSHLKNIMSISKEGESTVVLSFEQGINMELAAMEVREKFAKVKDKMPKEAEKPIIAQFSQSDAPIVILAVTSKKRTPEDIRTIVEDELKPRFKRIKGVANVEVGGGRERKIMVEVNKNALYRYGASINMIISALGGNNLNILVGELKRDKDKILIRAMGQLKTIEEIKRTPVVTRPDGSIVTVNDFAKVKDSFMEAKTYSRINVNPVVSLYIQKETKGNTISVVQDILAEIEFIKENVIPDDMRIIITKNQSKFISTSIANLRDSLLRGALMIIFVLVVFMSAWQKSYAFIIPAGLAASVFIPPPYLYYFMIGVISFVVFSKEYRAILIVAVSIPVSLIITFGVMDFSNMSLPGVMDLTINFITLFGLALGVGMLVDNSIVVFENIATKHELGFPPIEAAIEGSTEMNVVIFASTLTTVIVFLPMLFVGKSMSLLYGGVAWTVTISLFVSLFVALMIVPLMCSRVNKIGSAEGEESTKEGFLKPFYTIQKKALFFIMRRRFLALGIAFLLFIGSVFLYGKMGKEYLGSTEQNRFTTFIELPTGAKLDASDEIVRKVEDMLKEVPEVEEFTSRVEAWSSKVYVSLVPLSRRTRSVGEIIDSLRPKVARLQPAFVYFEEEQEVGTKEIILNVFGYDYDILREIAIAITTRMGRIPYFTDTKIRMREGRPELWIRVDKSKSAGFDMTTKDIGDIVHAKVRGVRATVFHAEEGKEVETITRMMEKDRRTIKDIHMLTVAKRGDDRVTLDQVADFEYGLGPSEIWRKDRARMIQVSANIGQLPLGKAVGILDKELSDLKLPEDYYYEVGGDYQTLIDTQNEFTLTILIILILIYLVLGSIFESYKQPFIIMVTVILATIGAIGSLYVAKIAIGMGALIGMMMLAGIVVNNGIILVDHANFLKERQTNVFRLLAHASRDRLRPVLMTTATTIFGLLPMAIDKSEGANLWNPLAVTVIGGLAFATPLTLVLVPAIYSIFEQFGDIIKKNFTKERLNIILRNIKKIAKRVFKTIKLFRKKEE